MGKVVGLALAWIGTFISLTALGWAVLGGIRLCRALRAHRAYRALRALRALRAHGTRRSSAPVTGEPIECLGANLCRLRRKLDAAENEMSATPFKAARVQALRGAYVDVLSAACDRLEVPPPAASGNSTVPLTEIYRAEAALRECGLDVRRQVAA
jgi:hypothetical protein